MTSTPSVAVVLAGPADHFGSYLVDRDAHRTSKAAKRRIDFARELTVSIVSPLLLLFEVHLLASCDGAAERAGWQAFFASLRPTLFSHRLHTEVDAASSDTCSAEGHERQCSDFATREPYGCACLPQQQRTLFVGQRANKYVQWAKLARAARSLRSLERRRGRAFDYIVRARNDFIYRPDQRIDTRWLLLLGDRDVAVPATAFQAHRAGKYDIDRADWQTPWPYCGVNDQLALGRREPMLTYLGIASPTALRKARASTCWPALDSLPAPLRSPERLLAVALTRCHGLRFTLFELTYVSTHFAGLRNGSAFDLAPEQQRMAEHAATGKTLCRYCLSAQRSKMPRIETSLELSAEGLRVVHGNSSRWSCKAPPGALRFNCTGGGGESSKGSWPSAACCRMVRGSKRRKSQHERRVLRM